ncbi:MAG: endonuclease/exonuclease/phosphatase family protein [Spirochaetaceae bacterium]|nr:endonuclease/exonuclease/phosphatase family protein [Spirochaetaceae bacterium]
MRKKLVVVCLAGLLAYKAVQFVCYKNPKKISIATWNVQTFFDADFSGSEYSEYSSTKSGWNSEKYFARLLRLVDALQEIDADIIALEEIENISVAHDIIKLLPFSSKLHYAVFAKQPGSALGLLVFSRYPITEAKAHQIQLPGIKPETLRPVLEVHVKAGGKDTAVLVNHWKSKASGGETSGIMRQCQSRLLAECVFQLKKEAAENALIIAAGDFNQTTGEFETESGGRVLFRGSNFTETAESVWLNTANTSLGSYYFRDNWEQIDHIFLFSEKYRFGFCGTVKARMFVHADGTPNSYKIYTGTGLSDHLPLKAEIYLR